MIQISRPIIGEEERKAVLKILSSGILTQGNKVKQFEEDFAKYLGVKHAVAVNSGTAGLHLSILASELKNGDEVITTPFSFAASANCILYSGAKPVFVDINPRTFNVNADEIEERISDKTKAILPVHLYGHPCNMDKIMKIAKKHKLYVIEDACQAHGAEYKGKKVGSFGMGVFSFYPTKNMTTGEGGIITTNNDEVVKKTRKTRNHGQSEEYYCDELGYNYRMTDIAATIGIEQLKKLNNFNEKRIKNARFLTENLNELKGIVTPYIQPNVKHVFHQYTIKVLNGKRDGLLRWLNQKGIGARVYYPLPLHLQPLYKNLKYKEKLPEAEKASKEVLNLPVHPSLTKEDLEKIVNSIKEFI